MDQEMMMSSQGQGQGQEKMVGDLFLINEFMIKYRCRLLLSIPKHVS